MGIEGSRYVVDPQARRLNIHQTWPSIIDSHHPSVWITLPNGYQYTVVLCGALQEMVHNSLGRSLRQMADKNSMILPTLKSDTKGIENINEMYKK